ncbi:hypothetical protein KCP76_10630 [Salmonella enterica subsp. enterica serovar Weltevreden]|nr:hypothetical protein KCP76_10630 [Salmonella enterica subsp. enterica serovar Weltevreden]
MIIVGGVMRSFTPLNLRDCRGVYVIADDDRFLPHAENWDLPSIFVLQTVVMTRSSCSYGNLFGDVLLDVDPQYPCGAERYDPRYFRNKLVILLLVKYCVFLLIIGAFMDVVRPF